MKSKKAKYKLIFISIWLAVFVSCSPIKYVPDGSYLLNKTEVKVADKTVPKEEADSYLQQKENLRILGFLKFHLWVYNLSSKKRANGWFKRIGEEPVVYNELLTQGSKYQLKQYFKNRGYYNANVKDEQVIDEKKRKINLKYIVTPGSPYIVRNVNYMIKDPALYKIFSSDTTTKVISPGKIFNLSYLEEERNRLTNLFKNEGYYDFGKDLIYFNYDTTGTQVDLDLFIKEFKEPLKPYFINKVNVSFLSGSELANTDSTGGSYKADTITKGEYAFISGRGVKYNPDLFIGLSRIKSGNIYRIDDVQETFNAFSGLNQFRYVNIQFVKKNGPGNSDSIDCNISLAPMNKQSISLDIEGTNTSGNFGVAGSLNFQHRNLFHNAEVLRVNLRGAMEHQQWFNENVLNNFNTREAGFEAGLTIPKLLGPGKWFHYFEKLLPQTVFTLGYNYQDRPDYTRTIANFKVGYNWKTTEFLTHTLNIADFNMVNLYAFNPVFINSIKDLYIKSSFTDHMIFASNYTAVFNSQISTDRKNYKFTKFSVESAGNLFNILSSAFGAKKVAETDSAGVISASYYRFLNNRYAQYVKADFEVRYGYMIDEYNSIVGRIFAGVGLPYGNFNVLPFEKKYFTGGANGIRAWQVRSLGPGTYKAPADAYPNQSSDIKLEANLEYRFKLIKILEGAIFFDAGNIWAVNDKDNREGAKFEINKFYKQIAIGTGTGLRFDFSYFIFRLDLGMKVRDPSESLGKGWIIGNRKLSTDDFNLSFAIGYPF